MRTLIAGLIVLAVAAPARAGTTIASGKKILCVLRHAIDSNTAVAGNDFSLVVDDPSQPALRGTVIHGSITDVSRGGAGRARIGFILTYLKFRNGTRAAIHAEVVGKDVVQSNTALARQEAAKFSLPPMPGTVTPGPVVWQIHFGPNGPSLSPPPAGNTSGYVYAKKSNETIVIPPGSPVTIQLTSDLTAP
jgi:hypothetical protein